MDYFTLKRRLSKLNFALSIYLILKEEILWVFLQTSFFFLMGLGEKKSLERNRRNVFLGFYICNL